MSVDFSFTEDTTVIVIGAGSGIGAATAELCTSMGAKVVLAGRTPAHLENTRDHIDGSVRVEEVDVANARSVEDLFERAGAFDHLVVTAADISYHRFADITDEDCRRIVDSKLWGGVYAARYGSRQIRELGSMTFLTGLAYNRPGSDTALISAVNGAIVSLVKALAIELAPIRVNAVSPGVTRTSSWDFMGDTKREFFDTVGASLPLKRIGEASDLAQGVICAMSNEFMTGSILEINGGGHLV